MIIVSDTSPLYYLAELGQESLLPALYGRVLVPSAVFEELHALAHRPYIEQLLSNKWLDVQDPSATQLDRHFLDHLDKGEIAAILLAHELHTNLLIDERKGRIAAEKLGIDTIGILGIFIEAKKSALIPAVKPIIKQLITKTNFRVSDSLIQHILRYVNER